MIDFDLQIIFGVFNDAKIRYVVLRNYTPLSDLNKSADIDILAHPQDFKKIKEVLLKNKWRQRFLVEANATKYQFFKFCANNKVYILDIQTDLVFGNKIIGVNNIEAIFSRKKIIDGNIFVPQEIHGLILYIFHLACEKNKLQEKDFEHLRFLLKLAKENKNRLAEVEKDFDEKIRLIIHALFEKYNFNDFEKDMILMTEYVRKEANTNRLTVWKIIKTYFLKLYMIFRPVDLVVFVGVDGSGKTTLIKKLEDFSPIFRTKVYFGQDQYFFKYLYSLSSSTKFSNAIIQNLSYRLKFFAFSIAFPFDILFRYLKAKIKNKYGIVIADRYPLPKQFSVKSKIPFQRICHKLSLRLIYLLLPRPKIVFILTGDPIRIWERKKERNYEKFLFDMKGCHRASDLFPKESVLVSVDHSIDESLGQIKNGLFDFFNKNDQ
jgi:thymidylate kinase